VIHYNWHWFWHWGNGELGNNGVHSLDLCRWGLGVTYPIHVSSGGGRYRYQDDQETPDTHTVTFDFPGRKAITWEGLSCNRNWFGGKSYIASFHGEKGALILTGGGYVVYDENNKVLKEGTGPGGDDSHVADFLDCVRSGKRPNAAIEEGHMSTLLPHLGTIAHRTGHTLRCDPKDGHILDDKGAVAFWSREYEKGWEPKV
jgi:predicted dehydrogenase